MGSVLPVQFAYSPKNEANCTSEYNTGYFQSIFEWTSSRWISGISRPLLWKQREAVAKYEWAPTLNYTLVSQVYLAGASVKLALQSKVVKINKEINVFFSLKLFVRIHEVHRHCKQWLVTVVLRHKSWIIKYAFLQSCQHL